MNTDEAGRFVVVGEVRRLRVAKGAPASQRIRLSVVEGRAARPVARRCTAEEATRSGLRVIGGAAARPKAEGVDVRDGKHAGWVKALWVGTVLLSAGAIWWVAL